MHPSKTPYLLYSDDKGNIFEDISLLAIGRVGNQNVVLTPDDLIELPEGSDFFHLPGRRPIGFDPLTNQFRTCEKGWAVAAFVAPAYTLTHHASWKTEEGAPRLPLYAYAAIGWNKNKYYTTAFRIDPDIRQDYSQFNQYYVEKNAKRMLKSNPGNRLLKHLSHCALVYFCPAARNYFMNRWEAPLPTSPTCNSRCVGCISYQPKDHLICSTQNRITFVPTPEEIAEIAIEHLNTAPNPVVSFGQGCEGEPLLVWEVLCEAIILIRKKTDKGIINLNSNASKPLALEKLCKAGLQSLRVSMNSAQEKNYLNYYNPTNYSFADVLESIRIARKYNSWVSVNYFVFPGYTDEKNEIQAMKNLILNYDISMIQWRNFNIDPEWYNDIVTPEKNGNYTGIRALIEDIRKEFPKLYHGYFNPGEEIITKYLGI
ncbi:MAG TPA: radical SAM protein [Bacteroidales bacterium]|mgnify:CR=1 FL=1|nr:radical SAM protein [Bacteroidales bacterium]